jgi:hypothetical protein
MLKQQVIAREMQVRFDKLSGLNRHKTAQKELEFSDD